MEVEEAAAEAAAATAAAARDTQSSATVNHAQEMEVEEAPTVNHAGDQEIEDFIRAPLDEEQLINLMGDIGDEEFEDYDQEEEEGGRPDPEASPSQQYEDTYKDVLHSLSWKWLLAQLTHKVSAKAANTFWDIAMHFLPILLDLKKREGMLKKTPKFIQQRRKLYRKYCPKVRMEFAFKKKSDGSITKVKSESAPLKQLQHNPEYIKLYEMASIKVINCLFFYIYINIYIYIYIYMCVCVTVIFPINFFPDRHSPTNPFTIWELKNPPHDVPAMHKNQSISRF